MEKLQKQNKYFFGVILKKDDKMILSEFDECKINSSNFEKLKKMEVIYEKIYGNNK